MVPHESIRASATRVIARCSIASHEIVPPQAEMAYRPQLSGALAWLGRDFLYPWFQSAMVKETGGQRSFQKCISIELAHGPGTINSWWYMQALLRPVSDIGGKFACKGRKHCLHLSVSNLEPRRQAVCELNHFEVQKRHSEFQGMSHRSFVSSQESSIRQTPGKFNAQLHIKCVSKGISRFVSNSNSLGGNTRDKRNILVKEWGDIYRQVQGDQFEMSPFFIRFRKET